MDPGMLHGQTFHLGHPHLWMWNGKAGAVQPKLMAFATNERCKDISPRSILALTRRLYGFVTASITTLIGTIANLMASFLTSTETSLLSWKSNWVIPFAPGSKLGLSMSLWCAQYLDRIGNTLRVKLRPIMIQQLSFQNPYTTSPVFRHCNQNNSAFTSSGKGN